MKELKFETENSPEVGKSFSSEIFQSKSESSFFFFEKKNQRDFIVISPSDSVLFDQAFKKILSNFIF